MQILSIFKNHSAKFKNVKENSTFSIPDPLGLELLTHLRLKFNYLNGHKFRHNFRDTVNPMCSGRAGIEITDQYFLRSKLYHFLIEFPQQNT